MSCIFLLSYFLCQYTNVLQHPVWGSHKGSYFEPTIQRWVYQFLSY